MWMEIVDGAGSVELADIRLDLSQQLLQRRVVVSKRLAARKNHLLGEYHQHSDRRGKR